MESLDVLVQSSLNGDADAYAAIVRRFQDMAVGYAYSVLRDFQLAEDAAQEAFFEAYRTLSKLREAAAFPGWFRLIIFKQCDRILRSARPAGSIDLAQSITDGRHPASILEANEMRNRILEAIESLSEHERSTTVLYYISGYSQDEVASFLEVPLTTVKKRLHDARRHLKAKLVDMVAQDLRSRRPSRSHAFAEQIVEFISAARARDTDRIRTMLQQNPRLLTARDPMGNTALVIALNSGYVELAELLLSMGVAPTFWEAAAIGDVDRLASSLIGDGADVDAWSAEGFTPLGLAAHFGHLAAVQWLIDKGADVNRVSRHPLAVTPLHASLFGGRPEIARFLIQNGADVKPARGGRGWPRAGWTALHYAVSALKF